MKKLFFYTFLLCTTANVFGGDRKPLAKSIQNMNSAATTFLSAEEIEGYTQARDKLQKICNRMKAEQLAAEKENVEKLRTELAEEENVLAKLRAETEKINKLNATLRAKIRQSATSMCVAAYSTATLY